MKRRQFIASAGALGAGLEGLTRAEGTRESARLQVPKRTTSRRNVAPRGTARLLYVSDPSSIAINMFPDPVREEDLRRWVDLLADSGVDIFDQEVYSQGWTAYWRSPKFEYDRRVQHRRFLPLIDAGIQPLKVLIDQTRKRGMTFVAGIRMNDNHGFQAKQQGVGIAKFIEAHPEWNLKEFPSGEYYKMSEPLDFTFDGVRDHVLSVMQEIATQFDVDGLEMCFRDHQYFPVNKGSERAHLMTDLVQKARAILDQRGKATGRKLRLGTRVFSTLDECKKLGLDVPTWISKGLIDYVSPQDVMYADFNAPYPEFAALTGNSKCMLYPALLPWSSSRARSRLDQIPLSPASQRAFVQTLYGAGADGISVYNNFTVMWHAPFYPQHLRIFHQLRDPKRVAAGERHYIFDPTWAGQTGFGAEGLTSTGALKAAKLVLDRTGANPSGEYRFSLYEDLEHSHGSTLLFRGFGLTDDDALEVSLNGHLIADSAIGRTRASQTPVDWGHVHQIAGRKVKTIPEQGRINFAKSAEPSFSTRWLELNHQLVNWGENVLTVRLTNSDPQATGPIVIDEIEIWVEPKSQEMGR